MMTTQMIEIDDEDEGVEVEVAVGMGNGDTKPIKTTTLLLQSREQ